MKDRDITQDEFDILLAWLDPNRQEAARKYESIRSGLILIFKNRGVPNSEDLADETINRVGKKVQRLRTTYEGNPALYFYGVAKNIVREQARHHSFVELSVARNALTDPSLQEAFEHNEESELLAKALRECLNELPAADRSLILAYYGYEKATKLEARKQLAKARNLKPGALWVRVSRIRRNLVRCCEKRILN